MTETYVKLKQDSEHSGMDVYCPIDTTTHKVITGLTLIGFVPENAEVIGEFDQDQNTVTLFKKKNGNRGDGT